MKKIDKYLKYFFIILLTMTILYTLEILFTQCICFDYPNINLKGKICGFFFSQFGIHLHKILGSSFALLYLLNIPYFIYLLITKKGLKKSLITLFINSITIVIALFVGIINNVIVL